MVLDTKTIIKTLEKFTACDVSDALVKKGFKNGGFFPNLIRQSKRTESSTPASSSSSSSSETVTPPMVGFAYTVLFAPYDDPRAPGAIPPVHQGQQRALRRADVHQGKLPQEQRYRGVWPRQGHRRAPRAEQERLLVRPGLHGPQARRQDGRHQRAARDLHGQLP
ncbi:organic cyclic compound binding protein [[Candida] boidinii]|nr:organic cyclic compound binding protein [[Candida] boidinii]